MASRLSRTERELAQLREDVEARKEAEQRDLEAVH